MPSTAAGYENEVAAAELLSGSRGALGKLYSSYAPALLGYLVKIVGDTKVAEGLLQKLYLQAWNERKSYNPGTGSVFGWLLRNAKQLAAQHFAENNGKAQNHLTVNIVNINSEPGECNGHLPLVIFELIYYNNCSIQDAVAILKIDEREIKKMLRKAIGNLKALTK